MGIETNYTLPGLRGPIAFSPQHLRIAEFYSSRESRNINRLIVSIFVKDQSNLLPTVTDVLDDGIRLSNAPEKVRFSIRSSLSAAVDGAFLMAYIVDPYSSSADETTENVCATTEEIATHLRNDIAEALNNIGVAESAMKLLVNPFRFVDSDILGGLTFCEYRFRATRGESLSDLRQALTQFTKRLAELSCPIAYLYFPDPTISSEKRPREAKWARIAVGLPQSGVTRGLEADLAANSVATQHRLQVRKYAPKNSNDGGSEVMIADYSQNIESSDESSDELSDGHRAVDVVFTQGAARTGYVAEMLSTPASAAILGGVMAVLGGHTLCCWVVPAGNGSRLEAQLRTILAGGASSVDQETKTSCQTIDTGHSGDAGGVWLAWSAPDRPGILRTILREVDSVVKRLYKNRVSINYLYSISRAIESQHDCAGKLRFSLDAFDGSPIPEEVRELILEELKSALPKTGVFKDLEKSEFKFRVDRQEPREEPWAILQASLLG